MNIYAIVTSPTFRLRFWNRLAMRYSYYIYKRVYTIKFYFIARNISFKTIQAANKFTFYRYCAYLFIDTSNILTNALLHRVSFNNVIIPCCRSTLFYLPTFAMTNFSVNTLFNTMNFPCINIDVWSGKFKYNDVDTRQIYAGFGYRIKKKRKKGNRCEWLGIRHDSLRGQSRVAFSSAVVTFADSRRCASTIRVYIYIGRFSA